MIDEEYLWLLPVLIACVIGIIVVCIAGCQELSRESERKESRHK